MKKLNVGMIGYGFMGRAHSNAYRKVSNFFDLDYQPVLKAACARNADNARTFAAKWGYESVETDWRKLVERKIVKSSDRVVVISTAHGLKFADQKTAYHLGTLPGIKPNHQNLPVELPADAKQVADTIARHVDRSRLLEA